MVGTYLHVSWYSFTNTAVSRRQGVERRGEHRWKQVVYHRRYLQASSAGRMVGGVHTFDVKSLCNVER
jgi:hypothetical protein